MGKIIFFIFILLSNIAFANWKIDVLEVYDGDTITADVYLPFDIVLRNQKIRLLYINAPEIKGKGVDEEQKLKGYKAKSHLIGLLKDKDVYLSTDPIKGRERDAFGRILGILTVDSVVINYKMIEDGHAVLFK